MLGDADIILAGGIESMSTSPYALRKARWGAKMGNDELVDLMIYDGLWDIFNNYHMGVTAENVAPNSGYPGMNRMISRQKARTRQKLLSKAGNSRMR